MITHNKKVRISPRAIRACAYAPAHALRDACARDRSPGFAHPNAVLMTSVSVATHACARPCPCPCLRSRVRVGAPSRVRVCVCAWVRVWVRSRVPVCVRACARGGRWVLRCNITKKVGEDTDSDAHSRPIASPCVRSCAPRAYPVACYHPQTPCFTGDCGPRCHIDGDRVASRCLGKPSRSPAGGTAGRIAYCNPLGFLPQNSTGI